MKGSTYPKRSRQESSKTFHNTLGRNYLRLNYRIIQAEDVVQAAKNLFPRKFLRLTCQHSHAIQQCRPVADSRFQLIAVVNWANSGGCAGQNQVAGQQRYILTGEGNDVGDGINHLAGARALFHFAVLPERDRKIGHVDIRINEWSDRGVGVERFTAAELFLGFLQIAIADVFANGVAENKIARLLDADIFCTRADDDGKLGFKIGLMFGKRDLDVLFVRKREVGALNQISGVPSGVRFISAMCSA